jgi:biotin synthase
LLCRSANFLRQKYHQNACCVHGILEISNHCARNCAYCGISANNAELPRYRMSMDEILVSVEEAVERRGFKAVILQSGESAIYSIDELAEIIRAIKQRHAVLILVSLGEIGKEGLRRLFDAGARGMLMRFETSNERLYRTLHPGFELETRIAHIREADRLGYLIITGGLVGLPGQEPQDIINDLRLAGELNAEMFSFGPVIPHRLYPLTENDMPVESDLLKVLALARLIAPQETKILVTTAFETLSHTAARKGLQAGANSLMLNVTPFAYRSLYSIYPFRAHIEQTTAVQVEETMRLLKSLGRVPVDLGIGGMYPPV